MLRADLFRPGDPDCAGVVNEVRGLGHVQAGRADEQQQRGGDDGEANAIHGASTEGARHRSFDDAGDRFAVFRDRLPRGGPGPWRWEGRPEPLSAGPIGVEKAGVD